MRARSSGPQRLTITSPLPPSKPLQIQQLEQDLAQQRQLAQQQALDIEAKSSCISALRRDVSQSEEAHQAEAAALKAATRQLQMQVENDRAATMQLQLQLDGTQAEWAQAQERAASLEARLAQVESEARRGVAAASQREQQLLQELHLAQRELCHAQATLEQSLQLNQLKIEREAGARQLAEQQLAGTQQQFVALQERAGQLEVALAGAEARAAAVERQAAALSSVDTSAQLSALQARVQGQEAELVQLRKVCHGHNHCVQAPGWSLRGNCLPSKQQPTHQCPPAHPHHAPLPLSPNAPLPFLPQLKPLAEQEPGLRSRLQVAEFRASAAEAASLELPVAQRELMQATGELAQWRSMFKVLPGEGIGGRAVELRGAAAHPLGAAVPPRQPASQALSLRCRHAPRGSAKAARTVHSAPLPLC